MWLLSSVFQRCAINSKQGSNAVSSNTTIGNSAHYSIPTGIYNIDIFNPDGLIPGQADFYLTCIIVFHNFNKTL